MSKKRDTYTYDLKKAGKIVHSGITNDLERREAEHQDQFPNSTIHQVGRAKTRESAREWEKGKHKTITPRRKPR